jgi:L-fuculose-phosphate aldolase
MKLQMDQKMERTFINIGRDLFLSGAITSHGGNLSMSDGEHIWITRTQSMLGRLEEGDVIETTWEESPTDANCSSELIVHRALYHAMMRRCEKLGEDFGTKAIVHAHTAHTTFRSMYHDQIEAVDSECKLLLPDPVQVVRPSTSIGSPEAAKMLGDLVEDGQRIGIIGGHGPFAIGNTLAQALQLVSSLEHSCVLADLIDQHELMKMLRENRN